MKLKRDRLTNGNREEETEAIREMKLDLLPKKNSLVFLKVVKSYL